METFKLIFEGSRCGAYSKLSLKEHLSLLKFSTQAIEKINNSKCVTLKSRLSYDEARKQRTKFRSLGLETSLKLELTPELFKLGSSQNRSGISSCPNIANSPNSANESTATDNSDKTSDSASIESLIRLVDSKFCDPTLLSRPGNYPISNKSGRPKVKFTTTSYSFRGIFLVLASAYMALTLQSYIIALLLAINVPNLMTSIISIIFLVAFTVGMPKVLQPFQGSTLVVSNKKIELADEFNPILGKQTVSWMNHSDESEGFIELAATKASVHNESEIYKWDAEQQVTNAQLNSIDDIQSQIIDGTAADTLLSLFSQLKALLDTYTGKKETEKWADQTSSAISNSEDEIVALIYTKPDKAYLIVKPELNDDPLLHAFCLYIQRNRLA